MKTMLDHYYNHCIFYVIMKKKDTIHIDALNRNLIKDIGYLSTIGAHKCGQDDFIFQNYTYRYRDLFDLSDALLYASKQVEAKEYSKRLIAISFNKNIYEVLKSEKQT